jgi:hypothetical protein
MGNDRRQRGDYEIKNQGIRLKLGSFQGEQLFFALDAPTITSECAILTHYSVARDGYRYGVGGAGPGYGPRGFRHADLLRYCAVGAGFAARNSLQAFPDSPLKSGGRDVERQ